MMISTSLLLISCVNVLTFKISSLIENGETELENNQETEKIDQKEINDLYDISGIEGSQGQPQPSVESGHNNFEEKVIKRLNDENFLLIPKVSNNLYNIQMQCN